MADEHEHLKKVHDKDAADYDHSSVFNDLEGLRKAQKPTVQRKKVLVNVKVGKPPNNCYFRAHPQWRLDNSAVISDSDERAFYYVPPHLTLHPKLAPRLRIV